MDFLAASIILIISNLGMGGTVGGSISQASFGIMGLLAYLFPVLLFGCAVFFISNRKNPLAYKKLLAGLVFWIFLCGLVQLLTEGYMAETTFAEYYRISSSYHTDGGVIGGAICISTTSAFGTRRWLCDHFTGSADHTDTDHAEIFFWFYFPCLGCCLCNGQRQTCTIYGRSAGA